MRFINLTRKIVQWTCSSVRGSNEPSKPIRIKKIHSHLIIFNNVCDLFYFIQGQKLYAYHEILQNTRYIFLHLSTLHRTVVQDEKVYIELWHLNKTQMIVITFNANVALVTTRRSSV
jgi:hypothetical protein